MKRSGFCYNLSLIVSLVILANVLQSCSKTEQKIFTPSDITYNEPTTGMEFIFVPGGCYQMGQTAAEKRQLKYELKEPERPPRFAPELRHEICVDGFFVGKYEVTVGQWREFAHDTGYRTDAENSTGGKKGCELINENERRRYQNGYYWDKVGFMHTDNHPVSCVSYNDVEEFIGWLTRNSGKTYRLPTEAEWEYSARGGTSTIRYWGDTIDNSACEYANVAGKEYGYRKHFPCDDGYKWTSPVGSFKPNGLGLYDILGNVSEWCKDWYGLNYYKSSPRNNPTGPPSGTRRVIRGGAYDHYPGAVRAAFRYSRSADYRSSSYGFRLVIPTDK